MCIRDSRYLMLQNMEPHLQEMDQKGYTFTTQEMQSVLSMQTCLVLHRAKILIDQGQPDLTALSTLQCQAGMDQEEAAIQQAILNWYILGVVLNDVIQEDFLTILKEHKGEMPDPLRTENM